MRSSIIPAHIANAARNLNYGVVSVKGFELGPVYFPADDATLPTQENRLSIVLAGGASAPHWSHKARPVDFYDLKGIVEAVLAEFGLAGSYVDTDFSTFQTGQRAAIQAGNNMVGLMGKVASAVARAFETDGAVYVAELNLDSLLAATAAPPQFQDVPTFPPSTRDLAVVVDADVAAGALKEAAAQAGGKLLRAVELFDIFTGEQVGAGKKSVALNLVFQSNERTLTDKDTQKAFDKILRRLQSDFKAALR